VAGADEAKESRAKYGKKGKKIQKKIYPVEFEDYSTGT
jgi:hypothetical protein